MQSFPFYIPEANSLNSALVRIEEINSRIGSIQQRIESVKRTFSTVLKDVINKSTFALTIRPTIHKVAKENNVDPKLIEAIIEQESRFNPNAVSPSGALGLMQLMPDTARAMGVKDPLNPEENIRGGTKYLSSLLNRYQGNVVLALSAYNAGPANVDKYNGPPPFGETKHYINDVLKRFNEKLAKEEK